MNNLPKVVTQQRRGRASNPRLLDRKSDALPLSHRAIELFRCRYKALAYSRPNSVFAFGRIVMLKVGRIRIVRD